MSMAAGRHLGVCGFRVIALCALFLAHAAIANAATITTLFNSNNGQAGNMFDIDVFGNDLNLTGISINARTGSHTFEFYYRVGSWQDNPADATGWTLHTTQAITGAGTDLATFVDIPDLILDANTSYGFYIKINRARIRYTNGTAVGAIYVSNSDLQIREGAGVASSFGQTFTPRIWNGTLHYDVITYDATVAKSVDLASVSTAGTTLNYTITVANAGNVALTTPVLTDALTQNATGLTLTSGPTLSSGDTNSDGALDLTETWTYTATYSVTQANMDDGNDLINVASFSADRLAAVDSNQATTSISANPELSVTKTADQTLNVPAGATVTYTYDITNTGNVTISNVFLNDAHGGSGTAPSPSGETLFNDALPSSDSSDSVINNGVWTTLAPGDTIRMTGTYVVTQNDIDTLQ